MAQARDEGLRVPMASRRMVNQSRSFRCPSRSLGHVGLERCLIDKDKAFEMISHEGLAARLPSRAISCNIRPLLLAGPEVFFCVTGRAGEPDPTLMSVEHRSLARDAMRIQAHQALHPACVQSETAPSHADRSAYHDLNNPEVSAPVSLFRASA